MKYELLMECTAGRRHAFRTVHIVILADGSRRPHRACANCKSTIDPTWSDKGVVLKTGGYKYSEAYRKFLDEHDAAGARAAILNSDLPTMRAPKNEKDNPSLRLVHGTRTTGKRRRPVKSVKRPRDKRRANA